MWREQAMYVLQGVARRLWHMFKHVGSEKHIESLRDGPVIQPLNVAVES